jgi:hypothetical protein
MEGRQRE